jgi:hypothetical protein
VGSNPLAPTTFLRSGPDTRVIKARRSRQPLRDGNSGGHSLENRFGTNTKI